MVVDRARAALDVLVQGFLARPDNGLESSDRPQVRSAALVLLFRLLFFRWAGERGQLPPVLWPAWSAFFQRALAPDRSAAPTGDRAYRQLQELGRDLGGLYDPARDPFLQRHAVDDGVLRQACRLLAQEALPQSAHWMGDLYEALLSERARKSSGSFYTPPYVVRFMVERTLRPLLEEAEAAVAGAGRDPGRLLLERVLQISVLDPAMGGGRFLIEAAELLSRFLADDPRVGVAFAQEGRPNWRLQVARHCLYGLDKDPLAVDLARLSLWLFVGDPALPLQFLGRRLRCGDALVGAVVADLAQVPPPWAQEDLPPPAVSAAQIQQSLGQALPAYWAEAGPTLETPPSNVLAPFRALADLWLSAYFGHNVRVADYIEALALLPDPPALLARPAVQRAGQLAQERGFFHWELAFPERFYDPRGRPRGGQAGFAAILGNPPYQFGAHRPQCGRRFLSHAYSLARGQYDSYWLFYERAWQLLRRGGVHGHIVPDALLARDRTAALRRALLERGRLLDLALVGTVFGDPQVSVVVTIWQEGRFSDPQVQLWRREGQHLRPGRRQRQEAWPRNPGQRWWVHLSEAELSLVQGLLQRCRPLGDYVDISRGEEWGKKQLLPWAESRPGTAPILVGSDIEPLSCPRPRWRIPLDLVRKNPAQYRAPKIVLVKTGSRLAAAVDEDGYLTLQSLYNLRLRAGAALSIHYLAALLNSRLLNYILWSTVTGYKRVFPQLNQSTVAELPLPDLAFTTAPAERRRLLQEGLALVERGLEQMPAQDDSAWQRWLGDRLDALPGQGHAGQVDVLHDLLAELARQMMALAGAQAERLQVRRAGLGCLLDEVVERLYGLREEDVGLVMQRLASKSRV
ncbi:MAG: N-6 DNA methylase [Chloroflexia bacterium]|nr:N-6 DNA methylase [Chloroflexia bacterium]